VSSEKKDLSQIVQRLLEVYEITADPARNDRAFRVAMEKGTHPLSSAASDADHLLKGNLESGWTMILELVKRSSSDLVLSYIAAGPLEDLIVAHPALLIDRIEEMARKDSRFRQCLAGVWKSTIPDDVWERIQKVIN
jgi:hypothetical protein